MSFSAKDPILGYKYQLLYGLYLILYSDSEQKIFVEHYDDLEIKDGKQTKYIQTKFTRSEKRITNSSIEIWNTLRNWSQLILAGSIDLINSEFMIILTAEISTSSWINYLKPENKNLKEALKSISEFANSTDNSTIREYYSIFEQLGYEKQLLLLGKISVLDGSPKYEEIEDKIKFFLRKNFEEKFIDSYYIDIRGWWEIELDKIFKSKITKFISSSSINPLINALVERHQKDILLSQMQITRSSIKIPEDEESKTYVRQLKIIKKDDTVIKSAKLDFLFTQSVNAKITEDSPYNDSRIKDFQEILKSQWETKSGLECEKISKESDSVKLIEVGSEIHRWAMLETTNLNFGREPNPSYTRGSFHELAEEETVGWHPFYKEELRKSQ